MKTHTEITIRTAAPEDAERLLEIYAPYVTETAITFEYEAPSAEEFRRRIRTVLVRYPYLAAEQDGRIVGYAYASAFHSRAAYAWSAETSIYVEKGRHSRGIGRRLYEALELLLRDMHILNLNACIAYPKEEDAYLTRNSVRFHERMGYTLAGHFHDCGCKFGRWYDMVWMEKIIGLHTQPPEPVRPFGEIRERHIGTLLQS